MKLHIPLIAAALLASFLLGCSTNSPSAAVNHSEAIEIVDAKVTQGLRIGKTYQVFDLGGVEIADGKPIQVNLGTDKICVIMPSMIWLSPGNTVIPMKTVNGATNYFSITTVVAPTNSLLPANTVDGTANHLYMPGGTAVILKMTIEQYDSLGSLHKLLHPAPKAILGKASIFGYPGKEAEVVFGDVGIRMTPIFATLPPMKVPEASAE